MKFKSFFILFIILFGFKLSAQESESQAIVDKDKEIMSAKTFNDEEKRNLDSLFKHMVVIQKKAIVRNKKTFIDLNFSFDFSDNPKTMYSGGIGLGYAFLENLEFHVGVSPLYINSDRGSVDAIRQLQLQNGYYADLKSPVVKMSVYGELYWIFAYGKDAYGPFSIVRSDTFLKLKYTNLMFKDNTNGTVISTYLGKTFFINKYFNFRFSAGVGKLDTTINSRKQSIYIGLIEPGLVWFF